MFVLDILSQKNINVFYVDSFPKAHIIFKDANEFCRYIEACSIPIIYCVRHYAHLEEMIITEDLLEGTELDKSHLAILADEVNEYNKKCESIDFSIPTTVDLFFYNPNEKLSFGYSEEENSAVNEIDIFSDPEDALSFLLDRHENWESEMQEKKNADLKREEEYLKQSILDTPEFRFCTNKDSRFVFLKKILSGEIGEKCPRLRAYYINAFNRYEAQSFIDVLWADFKSSGFQR